MNSRLFAALVLLAGTGLTACRTTVEVKPIHVTVDVNVNVRVEKALDDFFGDLDKKSATIQTPTAKP